MSILKIYAMKIYSLLIMLMTAMRTDYSQISTIGKIIESEYPKSLIIVPLRSYVRFDTTKPDTFEVMVVKDPIRALDGLKCCITMDSSHPHVQTAESNTIPGWGSADTLCVLDGVPFTYRQVLNMGLDSAKIKSNTLLNAEDATAIYGVRGINGTYIIVTRKKSKTKTSANRISTASDKYGSSVRSRLGSDVNFPKELENVLGCCCISAPPHLAPGTHIIVRLNSLVNIDTPLYIVNGMLTPEKELARLTSNNIETIEMLRQDAATAAFGCRGVNGGVIITTRKRWLWKQAYLKF